jgi:serine/threonine protein kinase
MQVTHLQVGNFTIKDQIDSGSFGVCHFAENIHTKQIHCVKIIPKSEAAKSEIEILSKVSHPNIVTFIEVETFNDFFFIFMEFCEGLTLLDMINTYSYFSEEDAKYIFQQLISALEYLHSKGISHGDIKLENIICSYDMKIKLIDFGFASESEMKYRGSLDYSAPEIFSLMAFDRKAADMWSAGVCLFAMVAGYLPFHEETNKETMNRVKKRIFYFPDFVSGETRYMIKSLLQYQPESRLTAREVLIDEWIVCEKERVHYVDMLAVNEFDVPFEIMC